MVKGGKLQAIPMAFYCGILLVAMSTTAEFQSYLANTGDSKAHRVAEFQRKPLLAIMSTT